ncbi:hypothetical protein B0H10DRAFT_1993625 [Mycena sp. CBHHK59/15]|nr:hypothetical protein B0H10DRAFT_1993625 [Mycena sp. CBHHK59/15]
MTVPTPLVACPSAPTLVSHPRIALCFENATGSVFSAFYTHSSSHSPVPNQPPPSPPDKKRSHRCFVCGGTGKHRLNPRFCPRTWELANNDLVKFNIDGRLVSFDGSPLPMTRHPGGVAAHLLSPRRLTPRTIPVSPRRVRHVPTPSSRSYESDPPHTPSAVAVPPRHVPTFDCSFESNPPHILPEAAAPPRRVPSLDCTFIVNPPHVPPVARIIPPSISTPIPRSTAVPKSNPDPVSKLHSPSSRSSHPSFILELFDYLILSPSFRRQLEAVIKMIDRLDMGNDPSSLRKVVEPIREHLKSFVVQL